MKNKEFEIGKTYYSQTRAGKIRLFKVSNVLRRKSTKERVFVVGSYDGKPEQRYEIRRTSNGVEFIIVDTRFCTVIDTTEFTGWKNVTEEDFQ
jgi:hypothetical protein